MNELYFCQLVFSLNSKYVRRPVYFIQSNQKWLVRRMLVVLTRWSILEIKIWRVKEDVVANVTDKREIIDIFFYIKEIFSLFYFKIDTPSLPFLAIVYAPFPSDYCGTSINLSGAYNWKKRILEIKSDTIFYLDHKKTLESFIQLVS
jgi:hypothetical protein